MAKALFIVQSRPSDPQREDDYNNWYDHTHLPEVTAVPGIVKATRYKLSETQQRTSDRSYPYLAIYELEADDLQAVLKELGTRIGDGRIYMSDAIETDPPPRTSVYELHTPESHSP